MVIYTRQPFVEGYRTGTGTDTGTVLVPRRWACKCRYRRGIISRSVPPPVSLSVGLLVSAQRAAAGSQDGSRCPERVRRGEGDLEICFLGLVISALFSFWCLFFFVVYFLRFLFSIRR